MLEQEVGVGLLEKLPGQVSQMHLWGKNVHSNVICW